MSTVPKKATLQDYLKRKKRQKEEQSKVISTDQQTTAAKHTEELDYLPTSLPTPGPASWDDIDSALSSAGLPPLLSPTLPPLFRDKLEIEHNTMGKHPHMPSPESSGSHDDNTLPPPLSPSLPPVFLGKTFSSTEESIKTDRSTEHELEIPQMLSPTLPPRFSLQQPNPVRVISKKLLSVESEEEGEDEEDEEDEDDEEEPESSFRDAEERKGSTNFEKVEYLGVHSYLFTKNKNEKKFLLTLRVPSWYKKHPPVKEKAYRIKKTTSEQKEIVGLGIKLSKKRSHSPPHNGDDKPKKKLTKSLSKETSSNSTGDTPNHSPQSQAQPTPENKGQLFIAKYEEVIALARDIKHKGDALKAQNMKLSVVHFMDCLITYLIGFHYEDQSRDLQHKLYKTETWTSLASLVEFVAKMCKESEFDDMTGLALQIKAVVYEHIASILGEHILMDQTKRKRAIDQGKDQRYIDSLTDHIMKNVKEQINSRDVSKRALTVAEGYLSIFDLMEYYPKIIRHFNQQSQDENCLTRAKKSRGQFWDPHKECFHLPIRSTVGIREIAAYALKVVKQWCRDEKVDYTDWTFQ